MHDPDYLEGQVQGPSDRVLTIPNALSAARLVGVRGSRPEELGLTPDYYILYSAASNNGAGSSRSASREAEGTGPETPRQPAQVVCGAKPGRIAIAIRRMSSERRKEFV